MMLAIRLADIEDLDKIVALRMAFLTEVQSGVQGSAPEVEELTRRYVADKLPTGEFLVWLAEEDQEIVGTGGLVFYHRPPTLRCTSELHAYILNMYTVPGHRCKGVATALLRHIIEHVKTTPARRVSLHATTMGRALYEQFGFVGSEGGMTLTL